MLLVSLVCFGAFVAPWLMAGNGETTVEESNINEVQEDIVERFNRLLGELKIVNAVDWAKAIKIRVDGLTAYLRTLRFEGVSAERAKHFKDTLKLVVAPLLVVDFPGDKLRAVLNEPVDRLGQEVESLDVQH